MNDLRGCYEKLTPVLGAGIEDYESVELVEDYRRYWKPQEVRIILLAESHVFTTKDDRAIELISIPDLPDYPTQYAKFVYCLAYGEKGLAKTPSLLNGTGTPQFWKILYSCGNEITIEKTDFKPILKGGASFHDRIQNKIDLLLHLQRSGVWLVDACITALYNKNVKPDPSRMASAITTSWKFYTRRVVEECAPKHVICVGRKIGELLKRDIEGSLGINVTVIDQPNARIPYQRHMGNLSRCSELCCELCIEDTSLLKS
jgi:hypothetical protein